MIQQRESGSPPVGFEIVNVDNLDKCTHCGFCLPTCPTYDALGLEMDSPRGRLYLIKSTLSGRSLPDAQFERHMYQCLECRACETACPSGVPFGMLMEQARAMYEQGHVRSWRTRLVTWFAFSAMLPHRGRLAFMFSLLWLSQRMGLDRLARATMLRNRRRPLGAMTAMLPPIPSPKLRRSLRVISPAIGAQRHRVGFVAGCVMHPMFADINHATVRVLARNGCEVVTPRRQTCCGALHLHNGQRDQARELARQNIDAFLTEDIDAIIINAAGCGAALKEYGELLADDLAYREKAHAFSEKMRDVTEWLCESGFEVPTHAIDRRVTYDDPCHLLHGQKVRAEPRKLIESIPGIECVPLRDSDWCCGSAGIYNILQPELAREVLEKKMDAVAETEAELVVTANPGCHLQLRGGIQQRRLPMRVIHIIELLDWAYRGVEPESFRMGR